MPSVVRYKWQKTIVRLWVDQLDERFYDFELDTEQLLLGMES